jgi:NAD-dependent DNA ligase
MSSQEFTCHVWSGVDDAKEYFASLKKVFVQLPVAAALTLLNEMLETDFETLPHLDLQLNLGDELHAHAEFGSEVPYALIEAVVAGLEAIGGIEFKARYFDSSSGGINVWGDCDDIELDGKNILLLGDMAEELEYLQEMVEGFGELQEALDEDTEVVILGNNPDTKILALAKNQGVEFITEDQFLEQVSLEP